MSSPLQKLTITLSACLCTLITSLPVYADDTEVFLGAAASTPDAPNVLFIIDTSGSMGNTPASGGSVSKLQIVKNVFNDLINNTNGINAALMRFDDQSGNNKGGYFLSGMLPLNTTTRATLISEVNGLTAHSYTPLAETMFEAARFYLGGGVYFGNSTSPGTDASGVMDATGQTYVSPIKSQCQKNFTILLTDGLPTKDRDADTQINSLIGTGVASSTTSIAMDKSCGFDSGDDCLEELTQYLYENDLVNDATIKGKQNVTTYTIGFDTAASKDLLTNAALAGGGKFYPASDATALSSALKDILGKIGESNNTFMAPTLAINNYNGLSHFSQLYFAQFQPQRSTKWDGNIKSYELYTDPSPSATCPTTLHDADGNDALEPAPSGKCEDRYKIKKTARSFWSTSIDGTNVSLGGAAGKLTDPATRHVYTNTGSKTDLTDATNKLIDTNSDITKTMLGDSAMSNTDRTSLLNWARGYDVDDANGNGKTNDARKNMGDPLHSQPVIVTYKTTDEKNANMVMFVGTNEGYLHAINVSLVNGSNKNSGDELFAYIPQELLKNLKTFRANSSAVDHPYGLDGGITAWVNDVNGDGTIDTTGTNPDSVYLYVGMRRGGRNYYALDVSNPNAPKLLWEIKGGVDADFTELGQSWSKPTLATINWSGTKTKVLIIGGGYDVTQDTTDTYKADSMGRALYIVDAKTGARLWWAGPSGSGADLTLPALTNSIPSDIRVADTNLNGLDDLVYVGDTHGQLFRFDIGDGQKQIVGSTTTTLLTGIKGGLVGSFGSTSTTNASDNRRFFYAPDLVIARPAGGNPYLSINIGSGYRAHPLSTTTQDYFYSLRDSNIFSAPETYTTVTKSDLDSDPKTYGWYSALAGTGEKVLAQSITFNGMIFYTTFTPSGSTTTCSPGGGGIGRLYVVDLFGGGAIVGSPVADPLITDSTKLTDTDRYTNLQAPGIPPSPIVAFNPKPTPCVGMQCFPNSINVTVDKTYWEQTQ